MSFNIPVEKKIIVWDKQTEEGSVGDAI